MRAVSIVSRRAGFWTGILACALLAMPLASSDAGAAKKKTVPAKKAARAPAPAAVVETKLSDAPPAEDLKARLAWAAKEVTGLRAIVAREPRDEPARVLLASLAVIVTSDLEHALARGDLATATGLHAIVEKQLADTRWRLGAIGRQGAGGGFHALAVMSLHGILGPRDREIACQLFTSAWDKGFLEAAWRLSECTAATDPAGAMALLRTAADAGNAGAHEQLGRRCLESTPPDVQCAARHVGAAASAGRPSAKSLLGWMTAQGVGMKSDPAGALALYLEAANAGDLSASNNLGELHETGRGVPVDAGRAVGYYRVAAEAGFAPAQFNLGRMYAAGTGVARDADAARKWLQAALKAGIEPAQKLLDWLDTQPSPVSR